MSTRSKSWASKVLGGAVLAGAVAGFGVTANAALIDVKLGTVTGSGNTRVFVPAANPKAVTVAPGADVYVAVYVSGMPGTAGSNIWVNDPDNGWTQTTAGNGLGGLAALQTSIQTGGPNNVLVPAASGNTVDGLPSVDGVNKLPYSLTVPVFATKKFQGFLEDLNPTVDPDTDLDTRDMSGAQSPDTCRSYGLGVSEMLIGFVRYTASASLAGDVPVNVVKSYSATSVAGYTTLNGWNATEGATLASFGLGYVTVPAAEVQFGADAVVTVGAVPEPASIGLLGLGSLALLARRRK